MKTLILTIALTTIAALGMAQFPQSSASKSDCYVSKTLRAAIINNNDCTVDVKLAKLPNEVVKIRITDDNKDGNILYQKRIKSHEVVNLSYDVKKFPKGTYTFEIVENKKTVFTKTIVIGDDLNQLANN